MKQFGAFERWLTLWVGRCIVNSIGLGRNSPAAFHVLGNFAVAQVDPQIADKINAHTRLHQA